MVFGFYITGGFHEDGLADVCDGFGGASIGDNQIHKKLSIMKDSSIGTFGGLGLFSVLLLKFSLLSTLDDPIFAMILMHTLSRAVATSIIYSLNYATADAVTKTKPLAEHLNLKDLIFILCFSILILFSFSIFYIDFKTVFTLVIILALTRFVLIKWFYKHLKGYTGDCLGFAQQTTEIIGYITLSATLLAL
jgi:adenosylcobinamide-GDP ribazoletransferase